MPLALRGDLGCYRGMNPDVAILVDRLREQPSHTGSLIVTLFGDAIMPRGGLVALSTILEVCAALGIGAGVVRTAISRLSADGWLVASRRSRASFYCIGPARRGAFAQAARHIFGPPRHAGVTRLSLALLEAGDAREALRERLGKLGFVAWQGVMLAPERPLPPSVASGVVLLTADAAGDGLKRLAAKAWRLDAIAAQYERFVAAFRPLLAAATKLDPRDSLLARLLLVHDYRRIILRDPRLPQAFLPEPWEGATARSLAATIYAAAMRPAEAWLDANAVTETGRLPPADSSLNHRFADMRPA